MKIGLYAALTGLLIAFPVLASEPLCTPEYERGRREIAAWAEMVVVMEGVIYGHSLALSRAKFCLSGTPKEQVQAIASAFSSDSYKEKCDSNRPLSAVRVI